jgi:hypothetical protein
MGDDELRRELVESREALEDRLGRLCRTLAYPYGDEDRRVPAAARAAGYSLAFALDPTPGLDPHGRVDVYRRDGLPRFLLKCSSVCRRRYAVAR